MDNVYYLAKPPTKGTVYLNVYENGTSIAWRTREAADRYASDERIACIEVPWVKGEGLRVDLMA